MTKMGQKLIKTPQKLRCFFVQFPYYSLKIFAGGGLGELWPTVALCLRPWRDAIVFKAPVLPVMVNGGRFER